MRATLVFVFAFASCSAPGPGADELVPRFDGGAPPAALDAGAGLDAGLDAGDLVDAGAGLDAGASDAGPPDSGAPLDAGVPDAGMDPLSNRGVTNPSCPNHGAQLVSWQVPARLTARWEKPARFTVKNTGATTWSAGQQFMLGAPGDSDPFVQNGRLELPPGVQVPPQGTFEFEVLLRAPEAPGVYVTSWQMLQEHVCWFGERLTLPVESYAPVATGVCADPVPPSLDELKVVVHIVGPTRITLDSTAKVCDRAYCSSIGFTDFRTCCPSRPEGHPDVDVCNDFLVGRASDTGRVGPTWRFDSQLCGPGGPGACDNHSQNQFLLWVYGPGSATACSASGVCGTVQVP